MAAWPSSQHATVSPSALSMRRTSSVAMTAPMTGTVIAFPMMRLSFAVFPASLHMFGGKPCNAAFPDQSCAGQWTTHQCPRPKHTHAS